MKIIYFILAVMTVFSAGAYPYDKTLMFYKGGVIALDQPGVNIAKIYGIKLSPLNTSVKSREKETFIHHRVENLGNATNSIRFEVKCLGQENAWSAQIVRDDNVDGIKQLWEYDSLSSLQDIGEGAVLSFFVIIKRPENAKSGDSSSALVKVTSIYNDGAGYIGYNGVKYGGVDAAEITDTVIVE